MKTFKRKEHILFLILLCTASTVCNPCANRTLNAIPYPSDCQSFILCWLSNAYIQACPNGLFFDIKTNNCQPLVATTCCNMTLAILIIPVPIYQRPPVTANKTNIWPFTTTTSFLPTVKFNTTNSYETTTSVISTTWAESSNSRQTGSGFTSKGTGQTEIETTTPLEPTHVHGTEFTESIDFTQSSVHTTPDIYVTSSTEPDSKKSTSTSTSEATTPVEPTLWTDPRGSPFTSYITEETNAAATTSQIQNLNATVTKFTESSQTNVHTTTDFISSTESSNKIPSSTLNISMNPSKATTASIFTLWTEPTDSSQNSSTDFTLNVTKEIEISTTPLETESTYKPVETSLPILHTTPASVYSTVSNNKYPSSTLLVSTHPPESTTFNYPISTLLTAFPDSSQYTPDVSKPTDKETATSLEITNTYINVTESSQHAESSPTNLYTISSIPYSTVSKNKEPSTIYLSTNLHETTTMKISTQSTELTDLTDAGHSTSSPTFSWNITDLTEVEIVTPLYTTDINVTDSTTSLESSQTNLYTASSVASTTDLNSIKPSTKLYMSTNPSETTTSIISTLWTELTDSSHGLSSPGFNTNQKEVETTAPIETNSIDINVTTKSADSKVYSTPIMVSPTELSNNTRFAATLTTDLTSTATLSSTLSPLNTEGLYTSTMTTITADTSIPSKALTTITLNPFGTDRQTFTESSTLSSINPSVLSTTSIKENGGLSTITENFSNITSTEPSTDFTNYKEYTTQENVTTATIEYMPTTSSSSQLKTTNNNIISSSMTTSSNVSPTVTTDTLQTEPQAFTELPIFPSTTNIPSYSQNTSYPISSTTELESTSIIPNYIENSSREFASTENLSTLETSNGELITSTQYIFTEVTSQSSPSSQFISTTDDITPPTETTVDLSSSSDFTETGYYITGETETTSKPSLTTLKYSSSTYTWEPVTLPSSPSNLRSTTDYTTIIPITTVSSYPSELNVTVSENPHFTSNMPSTFRENVTKTTEYVIEGLSTTVEPLATVDRSIMTVVPLPSTTEPTTYAANTATEPHTKRSGTKGFISTQSTTLLATTLSTDKSITIPTERTTTKPVVTETIRTLPPLPYSPPPCHFVTTTQKSTKSVLPTIPSIVTSTSIKPESSTQPLTPMCGFWDKFLFPDQSDCRFYYECSFGSVRKVSCRYGYEFNPYALKCMPHLEANCQRRKSSDEVTDFLYNIMKLNDLDESDPTEDQTNDEKNDLENGHDETNQHVN